MGGQPSKPRQPPSAATVEFGRRVRELREGLRSLAEALAARAGVHWTFLGHVERRQRSIRFDNILRIAGGLGVGPGLLLDGLVTPNPQ